jgi:hypothetical protein
MSEEDLEILITLDDPEVVEEEDKLYHDRVKPATTEEKTE